MMTSYCAATTEVIDLRADADILPHSSCVLGTPWLTYPINDERTVAQPGTLAVSYPALLAPRLCGPPPTCLSRANQSEYMDDCQAGEASDDESVASSSEQSESYIQFTEARHKVSRPLPKGLARG